jgi:hypothetical protein
MNIFRLKICDLLGEVNQNYSGVFNRDSHLITILPKEITQVIGDYRIHISEFIIAKVKGRIEGFVGHPQITEDVFLKIPDNLLKPSKILKDIRTVNKNKFLFINSNPLHQIVIDILRLESGLTEINTIFDMKKDELKRLEARLPTVFRSGETPVSRIHAPPL